MQTKQQFIGVWTNPFYKEGNMFSEWISHSPRKLVK